ncbi:MAG TPA: sigma-54 dependent transcriptional regulator [Myxococcaceae bacterium]|nr:sigma-54 dependent transcriptional regulator [Myxococcaceae bacterium]
MPLSILLVDDDRAFASLAAAALTREGYPVTVAHSLHAARQSLHKEPDLVVLDRRLPDGDGLMFLPEVKSAAPRAVVMVVTAHGDIASAVEAVRAGAADYLTKPVELPELVMKARRAAGEIQLHDRLSRAEAELSSGRHLVPPRSQAMREVVSMLDRIGQTPGRTAVLLLGETGAGKEVLASYFHTRSVGAAAPFVHLNCAAIPAATAESELFGHERGAFTDAGPGRRGLVEVASSGTLFLDEVGDLPLPLQAKLLTFLDSGTFRRLGAPEERRSEARIVAATNRDLETAIKAGAFREDLWYRLSVFSLRVPPLRERREDILPLAEHVLAGLRSKTGRSPALTAIAQARLLAYPFPGNVRELRNILERAVVMETGDGLQLDVLARAAPAPGHVGKAHGEDDFVVQGEPITSEELERRYARHVLQQLGGKRMEAAKAMGISYPTFLKRLGEGE